MKAFSKASVRWNGKLNLILRFKFLKRADIPARFGKHVVYATLWAESGTTTWLEEGFQLKEKQRERCELPFSNLFHMPPFPETICSKVRTSAGTLQSSTLVVHCNDLNRVVLSRIAHCHFALALEMAKASCRVLQIFTQLVETLTAHLAPKNLWHANQTHTTTQHCCLIKMCCGCLEVC